jgi:hypothetical protein
MPFIIRDIGLLQSTSFFTPAGFSNGSRQVGQSSSGSMQSSQKM